MRTPLTRRTPIRQAPGPSPQGPASMPLAQRFDPVFGPEWQRLPLDLSGYSAGAAASPKYPPQRGPSRSLYGWAPRLAGLGRFFSIAYVLCYAIFLAPVFRLGAYRLTLFERAYRLDSILVGESFPLALRRARRIYRTCSPKRWSPLAGLPPGARVSFPSPLGGDRISGIIAERHEFIEPQGMRQWRLYIFESSGGAGPDGLVVLPARPGDWRRVKARAGRIHCSLPTSESPIGWPPASKVTILGAHGWPSEYAVAAASWPLPGIDPLSLEMTAAVRRRGDPPGRQCIPRVGAHWLYTAVPGQKHPSVHQFFEIFLAGGEVIILETNWIDPKLIEFDLGEGRDALKMIRGSMADE